MIIGYFVTLFFFPDLYTGPKYTDVGPRVEGLVKRWKRVQEQVPEAL